jgi:YD repeat-containing protein
MRSEATSSMVSIAMQSGMFNDLNAPRAALRSRILRGVGVALCALASSTHAQPTSEPPCEAQARELLTLPGLVGASPCDLLPNTSGGGGASAVTWGVEWVPAPQGTSGYFRWRTPMVQTPQGPRAVRSTCWGGPANMQGAACYGTVPPGNPGSGSTGGGGGTGGGGNGSCEDENCFDDVGMSGSGPAAPRWMKQEGPIEPVGLSLNANVMEMPAAGTFLPRGETIGASSLALVPPGMVSASTSWGAASRATLDGEVDFATGLPLTQFTDLSLPFGSATFRLNRTRSGDRADMWSQARTCKPEDRWWDWAGMGWMISENPILYIDSTVADMVGDSEPTCFVALDAHHMIPFQLIDRATNRYEAPPRFRARMEASGDDGFGRPSQYDVYLYDGALRYTFVAVREDTPPNVWWTNDPLTGCCPTWIETSHHEPPYLPQHLVKDSSGALVDEHDRWRSITLPNGQGMAGDSWGHWPFEPSQNRGVGMPAYGLLVRIEDQHGHRVEIDYCEPEMVQVEDENPQTTCVGCMQTCLRKGQIRSVRLVAQGVTKWTLAYTHRLFMETFPQLASLGAIGFDLAQLYPVDVNVQRLLLEIFPPHDPASRWLWSAHGSVVLDTIHAYEGVPSTGVGAVCLTKARVGAPAGAGACSASAVHAYHDDLADDLVTTAPLQAPGWRYRVKYHYLPAHQWSQAPGQSDELLQCHVGLTQLVRDTTPILVRTSLREKAASASPASANVAANHVFVYDKKWYDPGLVLQSEPGSNEIFREMPWLVALFTPEDVARVTQQGICAGGGTAQPCVNVDDLALGVRTRDDISQGVSSSDVLLDVGPGPAYALGGTIGLAERALDMASVRMTKSPIGAGHLLTTDPSFSWPAAGDFVAATPMSNGRPFIGLPTTGLSGNPLSRLANDAQDGTVGHVQVRDASGAVKMYRVMRFVWRPDLGCDWNDSSAAGSTPGPYRLTPDGILGISGRMNSVWAAPYRWKGYYGGKRGTGGYPAELMFGGACSASAQEQFDRYTRAFLDAPDLAQPRWISVIDEFATWESMVDGTVYSDDGVKPQQRSRRTVQLNAAGYVLKDQLWTLTPEGTLLAGGGLGAESVFASVGEYFQSEVQQLENQYFDSGSERSLDLFREELLLVERRSVGWSALTAPSAQASDGLVEFFRYDFFAPPAPAGSGPWSAGELAWPFEKMVQMSSYGVQRGAQGIPGGGAINWRSEPSQPRLYLKAWYRDALAPWDQLAAIDMLQPVRSLSQLPNSASMICLDDATYHATLTSTQRGTGTQGSSLSPKPWERPLRELKVLQSARVVRPGIGSHQPRLVLYPCEQTSYGVDGQVEWEVSGLLPGASGSSCVRDVSVALSLDASGKNVAALSLNYTFYEDAEPRAEIVNTAPGQVVELPGWGGRITIPPLPAGWPSYAGVAELRSASPASVTVSRFDANGLKDRWLPDGTRWARRWVTLGRVIGDQDRTGWREYVMPDLVEYIENGAWEPMSVGTARDVTTSAFTGYWQRAAATKGHRAMGVPNLMASHRIMNPALLQPSRGSTQRVRQLDFRGRTWDVNLISNELHPFRDVDDGVLYTGVSNGVSSADAAVQVRRVSVTRDGRGRVEKTELEEQAGGQWQSAGTRQVNDLGEVVRSVDADGTVTRVVRSPLGQTLRTYAGTDDAGWGSGAIGNLVLLTRSSFGNGVRDAWLPVLQWNYDANPAWAGSPYGEPGDLDPHGVVTRTKYDWRMRPAIVETFERGQTTQSTPLTTSVTLLDIAGRERLVVTYGVGSVGTIDPMYHPAGSDAPELTVAGSGASQYGTSAYFDAAAMYYLSRSIGGASPAPLVSVVRKEYDNHGLLIEERDFDPAAISGRYTVQFRGYGVNGAEVFHHAANSPATIRYTDSMGWVHEELRVLPDAVQASGGGGGGWGAFTHQLTRTRNWFDPKGRIIDSVMLERAPQTQGPTLRDADEAGGINALRTRTLTWYTIDGQVAGTIEESGHENGMLAADAAPWAIQRAHAAIDYRHRWLAECATTTGGCDPALSLPPGVGTLPPNTRVHAYRYDARGNLVLSRDPSGLLTRHVYDTSTGTSASLTRKIENAGSTDAAARRETHYQYERGRLVAMAGTHGGVIPTVDRWQRLVFGDAVIVARVGGAAGTGTPDYLEVSRHHGMAAQAFLPVGGSASVPGQIPSYRYKYTVTGQLAEREDARGISMRYFYDALGRLEEIEVGSYIQQGMGWIWQPGYPDTLEVWTGAPLDRVGLVRFAYDARGNLTDTIAKPSRSSPTVISHTRHGFDPRGFLVYELQALGEGITSLNEITQPRTTYSWQYEPHQPTLSASAGQVRLQHMGYPQRLQMVPNWSSLKLNFGYGLADSPDDQLNNITSVDRLASGTITPARLASFGWFGEGRRFQTALGPATGAARLQQDASLDANGQLFGGIGLPGFESFGRVVDHHVRASHAGQPTLFRGQHTYDFSGNRTSSRVTQAPVPLNGAWHANQRSVLYGYDGLQRLTSSTVGSLAPASDPWTTPALQGTPLRSDVWRLDALGNWTGNPTSTSPPLSLGRSTTGNLDNFGSAGTGYPLGGRLETIGHYPWFLPSGADAADESTTIDHAVDAGNRLTQVQQLGQELVGGTYTSPAIYDPAGNLIFDGVHLYQYDAWQRLVQVNRAIISLKPNVVVGPDVSPYNLFNIIPHEFVKHYTYDGIGRLARVQAPWPDWDTSEGRVRSTRLYYDGVRRIQEVITDPVLQFEQMLELESNPQLQAAAEEELEAQPAQEVSGEAVPIAIEEQLADGVLSLESGPANSQAPPGELGGFTYLHREYVWGPGDRGIDELLVVSTGTEPSGGHSPRTPWYTITDTGGDVVALVEITEPGTEAAQAHVAAQWTYDAYGNVLSADFIRPHPKIAVGHKGLFAERLDVWLIDFMAETEFPVLVSYSRIHYHTRNRVLDPTLGRWLQRDPNATGQCVIESLAHHGRQAEVQMSDAGLEGHMEDGLNTHQYVRGNPIRGGDPLGLFDMGSMMFGSSTAAGLQSEWTQNLFDFGSTMQGAVASFFGAAAMEQMLQVDWAFDWSEPDDLYVGSANWSMNAGSWGDADQPRATEHHPGFVQASNTGLPAGTPTGFSQLGKAGKRAGVYILQFPDGTLYVGRSVNVARRLAEHRRSAKFKDVDWTKVQTSTFAISGKNRYERMRGAEQKLINAFGGIHSENKRLINKINGYASSNQNAGKYQRAINGMLNGMTR